MTDFSKLIIEKNIISPEQLDLITSTDARGEPLYYRLFRHYPELEGPLWQALAEFLQVELVNPNQVKLDPSLSHLLPAQMAHDYSIVPLCRKEQTLEIALADPQQFEKCEEYSMLLSRQSSDSSSDHLVVVGRLARPSDITTMIKSLYGIGAETVQQMIEEQNVPEVTVLGPEVVDLTRDKAEGKEDAAIIKFVNQILLEAVKIEASDIHLEPFEKDLRVRYRVDGMLRTEPVPEKLKHLESAIISRIKIMAQMDIAERRLPQDGQIRMMVMGRPIDVRVSILPTMFGQGLALRLLDRKVMFHNLDNLGMPEDYLRLYRSILKLSHGVILVTGPTGSGKTTTLYASINEINRDERKIITVEDPIEYQLEGITQIQVKPQIGLDFANLLRNILRHDPDVIMVGEIRDRSTAQIAISAAMTGHLVFSTLHTNDAPSAPIRLLEMGVEPYLVASAVEAAVAQRLVRLLCTNCRQPTDLNETVSAEDRAMITNGTETVYDSKGCPVCEHTGFKGRTAIFEMFAINDHIRKMILARSDSDQIRKEAQRMSMRTLHQSGMEKVRRGLTSLAEVYRVARDETIDMQTQLK